MDNRFRFALRHTTADHWLVFEHVASEFLSDEYANLRTLANTSGDGGRDSVLYQPEDDPAVALQYSTTENWKEKVRRTARRLSTAHPEVRWLIYVSPQEIGALGDDTKGGIWRDFHVRLDIRDRNWFGEREERSSVTRAAAERLCRAVVTPLLRDSKIVDHGGIELSSDELRAALLYLVLQRKDDSQDRSLTKLCFDAIVKAILRDTNNEKRMTRAELHHRAIDLFPSHDPDTIQLYVDRALGRLDKRVLRHYNSDDTWLLNYDERARIEDGVARLAALDEDFLSELESTLLFVTSSMEVDVHLIDVGPVVARARRILERFLYTRGELFAESVARGQTVLFAGAEIEEFVKDDLLRQPDATSLRDQMPSLIAQTLERILVYHSDAAQSLLRAIADGYTLFAFMREAPNVQSAVTKLFSQGEFWLDTTAVLPLMAERLLPAPSRNYSNVILAAISAGAKVRVTPGVVNELSAHIDISLQAWRAPDKWNGRTPFLLQAYIWSGEDITQFATWIEYFRGSVRPEEDIEMYLVEECRIEVLSLAAFASAAADDLRWQSEAYWQEIHQRRRRRNSAGHADTGNPETVRRLAEHDSETFLGVLERRKHEDPGNPFGYTTWWLTLDSAAHNALREIAQRSGLDLLHSPVVNFEFLTYYLMVGPARRQLDKSLEQQLPLAFEMSLVDSVPSDLLAAAQRARESVSGQDDRLVRRRVRDQLDSEKIRRGRVGRSGLDTIREDIRLALGG